MDAIKALFDRRSVRVFKEEPVKKEDLETILKAGLWAPSGANRQLLKFVVVTDPEVKKAICEACPGNTFVTMALVNGIVVAEMSRGGTPLEDGSAAVENMMIAATALGYGTCWIGSHGNDRGAAFKKICNFPDNYETMAALSIGVPADELPERAGRAPLDTVVVCDKF